MFDIFDNPFEERVDHGTFKNLYLEDYKHMKNRAARATADAVTFLAIGKQNEADQENKRADTFNNCAEGILAVALTIPMADA